MPHIDDIIATLDQIISVDDHASLAQLEQALDDLFQTTHPERGMDALFRIYERFPESDGYGIFWTILHGLEHLPNYEHRLIESVQRQPMEFNLSMVNRLLNAGVRHVGSVELITLLARVASDPQYSEAARTAARDLVDRHRRSEEP